MFSLVQHKSFFPIADSCVFQSLTAAAGVSVRSNKLNNQNLTELANSILTTRGEAVMAGNLQVIGHVTTNGDLNATSIMGVDIDNLFSDTVLTTEDAVIRSSLAFRSPVRVEGDVDVRGLINSKSFPNDFSLTSDSHLIADRKTFRSIAARSIVVDGLIDGIRTDEIVTLTTDQNITGAKNFRGGIDVSGDLDIVSSIIDGVNLDEINTGAQAMAFKPMTYDVVFEEPVTIRSLNISGAVNGFNFTEVVPDLVRNDEPFIIVQGKKTFAGDLKANSVSVDEINDELISDFVARNSTRITGEKQFENGFTTSNINIEGLVNGVNITHLLKNALYTNKEGQFVTGTKKFLKLVNASELNITETVNDINFRNVATTAGPNVFTVPQFVGTSRFNSVNCSDVRLLEHRTVNDINIDLLAERAVYLDSDQQLFHPLTCIGNVAFKFPVVTKRINDLDLNEFSQNLAKTNEPNTILSEVHIRNLTVVGNITTTETIGQHKTNFSELDLKAIKLDSKFLDLPAIWEDLVFEDSLSVSGTVNGYDLTQLEEDAVYEADEFPITFSGGREVKLSVIFD